MSSPATPIRVLAIDDDDDIQALLRVALVDCPDECHGW